MQSHDGSIGTSLVSTPPPLLFWSNSIFNFRKSLVIKTWDPDSKVSQKVWIRIYPLLSFLRGKRAKLLLKSRLEKEV
jgi:hypothetical protein